MSVSIPCFILLFLFFWFFFYYFLSVIIEKVNGGLFWNENNLYVFNMLLVQMN